jgi:uncharacterized RDD family membrane protein YckC
MEQKVFSNASTFKRIINSVVDMTTFFIIWIILSVVLMILGFNKEYTDETRESLPIAPFIILIPTFWGYYIITEYFFQKTLGKLITKTKVISTKTFEKPTLLQIIGRTLSRSIPFEYFSFFASTEGFHDKLSKTRVININETMK